MCISLQFLFGMKHDTYIYSDLAGGGLFVRWRQLSYHIQYTYSYEWLLLLLFFGPSIVIWYSLTISHFCFFLYSLELFSPALLHRVPQRMWSNWARWTHAPAQSTPVTHYAALVLTMQCHYSKLNLIPFNNNTAYIINFSLFRYLFFFSHSMNCL